MEKNQFSVPISYPFKTDGCKDKKAIVITKCFIRYNIAFEHVKSNGIKNRRSGALPAVFILDQLTDPRIPF